MAELMLTLALEIWLPVVGYEGLYEVSNFGRIKSLPRNTTRGGIMKLSTDKRGVKVVNLTKDGKQRVRLVHQLVLEAFVGPRPEGIAGEDTRHLDGNPSNNHLSNLKWGSTLENVHDMIDHGTASWQNLTHCTNGHEYTPENTKLNKKGARVCATCQAEHAHRNYLRYKAEGKTAYVPVSELEPEKLERVRARAREAARVRRARQRAAGLGESA